MASDDDDDRPDARTEHRTEALEQRRNSSTPCRGNRDTSAGSSSSSGKRRRGGSRGGSEDLRITIPIVKPKGWQEVQPLVDGKGVTFDERGVKETMTVKAARWDSFVDRQKKKLQKEIVEARTAQARQIAQASAQGHPSREAPGLLKQDSEAVELKEMSEDDITELEQMVARMDDWKDLSAYSGKSISMASTRRGNEMKIHVMAFAEREDGGVDFMRLSYRKSVEVRGGLRWNGADTSRKSSLSLGETLRTVLPFGRENSIEMPSEEKYIQLLRQPDLAKFTIAFAYRHALEADGIHLDFCESAHFSELGA